MTTTSTSSNQRDKHYFLWIVLGITSAFWFLEAVLYALISDSGSIFQRMVDFDINDVAMRVLVLCFFAIFGSHVHYITRKRREADEALKLSETKQASIIENMEDGYFETSLTGELSFFNRAFQQLCGLPRDRLIGSDLFRLVEHSHRKELKTALNQVATSGNSLRDLDITMRSEDGELRYIDATVTPVVDISGAAIGYRGLFRDITKRVLAEKLQKEKIAALAASKSKSDFLANMSHEIRTPLNSIIGLVELTLDSSVTDEQREDLNVVLSASHALLSLINDILDFSKIEAGKLELDSTDFSLRDFLGETLRIMAFKANEKTLELAYRVHRDVPDTLKGDTVRFRQIVLNLVGNAIKFTEEGEVILAVDIENRTENKAYLHCSVKDTGIGIPPEKQEIIFSPFDQADGSTTRRYGGTGLGLAVSSQLVELMGGKIWLDSRVGQGSTFHFTIPFEYAADDKTVHASTAEIDLAGIRILVVDDNASSRSIIKEIIESWRMFAIPAEDLETAMHTLSKRERAGISFDIVVIDAHLGDEEGKTLVKWMRDQRYPCKIVLMMSSAKDRGEYEDIMAYVSSTVLKPIRPSDLLDAINEALGFSGSETSAMENGKAIDEQLPMPELNILVVEDTAFNQKYITRLLENWGFRSTVVGNGRLALEELAANSYDLVLMDIQMPEMDGFEATKIIRRREKQTGSHTPIVAMTAHAMKGDRERCLEAGMDAYVSKPIYRELLFETILSVVAKMDVRPERKALSETIGDEVPPDTIDMESLLAAFCDDFNFLKESYDIFLSDYSKIIIELQEALSSRSGELVKQHAHALKGLVGSFQAKSLHDDLQELELMGMRSHFDSADELFNDILSGIESFKERMNQIFEMNEEKLIEQES